MVTTRSGAAPRARSEPTLSNTTEASARRSSAEERQRDDQDDAPSTTDRHETTANEDSASRPSDEDEIDDDDDDESETATPRQRGTTGAARAGGSTSLGATGKRRQSAIEQAVGNAPAQKKTKTSQPPWTEAEESKLLEIAEFVERMEWDRAEVPKLYARHCGKQNPPWHVRPARGVLMKLTRLQDKPGRTPWTEDEMQLLNSMRAERKSVSEIHAAHQEQFAIERSKGAIKQKLQFLPVWKPGDPVPPAASSIATASVTREDDDEAAAGGADRVLMTTQRYWDPAEDAFLSQYKGKSSLHYPSIQRGLERVRVKRKLPFVRSIQAVATRIRELSKMVTHPRRRVRLVYWDPANDTVARRIAMARQGQEEAVAEIATVTKALPAFVRKRWPLFMKCAEEETKTNEGAPADDLGERPSVSSVDAEADDLRRDPPDSWMSDYPTSCASGWEGDESDDSDAEQVADVVDDLCQRVQIEYDRTSDRAVVPSTRAETEIEEAQDRMTSPRPEPMEVEAPGSQMEAGGEDDADLGVDAALNEASVLVLSPAVCVGEVQDPELQDRRREDLCSQPTGKEGEVVELCNQPDEVIGTGVEVPATVESAEASDSRAMSAIGAPASGECLATKRQGVDARSTDMASATEEVRYSGESDSDDAVKGYGAKTSVELEAGEVFEAGRELIAIRKSGTETPRPSVCDAGGDQIADEGLEFEAETRAEVAEEELEAMTPMAEDTDEESTEQDASQWLIRWWSGPEIVSMNYEERNRVWDSRVAEGTGFDVLRREFIRRAPRFEYTGPSKHQPKARVDDMKTLLFGISLLLRTAETRLLYLRELWGPRYGCRAKACCLAYDATNPNFSFSGCCRHWLYLQHQQVYLDRFKDMKDYLLALALSIHRDAYVETGNTVKEPDGGWRYRAFKARSFGRADDMFVGWPRREVEGMHVQPILGSLRGIVLETSRGDPSTHKWQDGDYGELYTGTEKGAKTLIGKALVLEVRFTKIMLTTAGFRALYQGQTELVWCAKANVKNYMRRAAFLDRLPANPHRMLDWFRQRDISVSQRVGTVRKRATETDEFKESAAYVDEDQLKVITQALTLYGIILARGPYGCGKTTLITHLVRAYRAAYPKNRIALVSETNATIEEDMARLVNKGFVAASDVVRLGLPRTATGEPFKPDKELHGCYLQVILDDYKKHLQQDKRLSGKEIEDQVADRRAHILATRPIVVATLAQLGKEEFADVSYHLVINDEGAQTGESSLVQAARKEVETVVIVGDPNQLLPYSPIKGKELIRFATDLRRHKLDWSIMHHLLHAYCQRLGRPDFPGVTMTAEFRSHPRITTLLQTFYNFALRDRARESEPYLGRMILPTTRLQESWFSATDDLQDEEDTQGKENTQDKEDAQDKKRQATPVNRRRVIWLSPADSVSPAHAEADRINKPYKDRDPDEANLINAVEATAVVELMLRIRATLKGRAASGCDEPKPDVLIITPYRSQVRKIDTLLRQHEEWLKDYVSYEVTTTDSSQGREAAITIVSLVRNKGLGFMENYPARSLVSLSRGRDYLFILACHLAYAADETWYRLLRRADEVGIPCMELEWTARDADARVRRLARAQRNDKMAVEEEKYVVGKAPRARA